MKKKAFAIITAAILAILLCCACSGGSQAKSELKFGTAGSGGTYFSYASKFADLAKDDFSFNIKTTAGSAANIRLMQEGFIDIALSQSDILESAEKGTGLFKDSALAGKERSYSAVAGLYTEALQIVVRADSNIKSVEDLAGRAVSVGEEESGVLHNAEQILNAYGLTFNDIETHYLSFSDSADAVRSGRIDAFFCTAGAPTSAITELAGDVDIRLLSLDQSTLASLGRMYAGYISCTIPAGTYPGQEEPVNTLGVKAVLIASNDIDPAVISKLTEDIFKYADKLNPDIATDDALDTSFATESVGIDFHKGAAEYYTSQGVSVAVNEGSSANGVFASQDE